MKTEEIDKKIGMPDIEEQWTRFEREVMDQPRLTPSARPWMSRAAAIILACCLVSGLVLAATLYMRHDPVAADAPMVATITEEQPSASDCEIQPEEEDRLLSCWDDAAGVYVFDNQELQLVAEALSMLYPVEPVFANDEVRHIRLYFSIDPQKDSIEEIVTRLNTFYHVQMYLDGKRLIIQ